MLAASPLLQDLWQLPDVAVTPDVPLAKYTRFAIGGPAALFVESADAERFSEALGIVRDSGLPNVVIGGGTNLIVSDAGFDGVVLRFAGEQIAVQGMRIVAEAGASLQAVVDRS